MIIINYDGDNNENDDYNDNNNNNNENDDYDYDNNNNNDNGNDNYINNDRYLQWGCLNFDYNFDRELSTWQRWQAPLLNEC